MVGRRRMMHNCNLAVLACLLASAAAFTGQAGFHPRSKRTTRPIAIAVPSQQHHHYYFTQLYADPSQADDENLTPPNSSTDNDIKNGEVATTTKSQYNDGDPRQALEQFGTLFSLVQEIFTQGNNWDNDKLEQKTQEFVRTYLRVFVPGLGYAVTSFGVFASAFVTLLLSLTISGRGYNDVVSAVSGIEPLRNLLEKADPSWGNAAIALIGCEVLGPVILAATLALTPKTMEVLRMKLDEAGWGEENIEERAAEILNLTS